MSSMNEMENQRYALTRGKLLVLLAEDYTSSMTSVGALAGGLDLSGFPITKESLTFHLRYLEDQGYVKVWRVSDMPRFRHDRLEAGRPDDVRFAKLQPKGLQLVDGLIPEDLMVKF